MVVACTIAGLLGAALAVGVSYFLVSPRPVQRSISSLASRANDLSSSVDDVSSSVSNACDALPNVVC
jgi:hypothetical protein